MRLSKIEPRQLKRASIDLEFGVDRYFHEVSTKTLTRDQTELLEHCLRGLPAKAEQALTTTSMLDKMCDAYGIELVETGVGFKYICAEMIKGNVLLGAEESGGIGFPGHIPERDGIAAGLMLLEMLAVERTSLNRLIAHLEKQFGPHRYGRIDTHFPLEKRGALMEFLKSNPPDKLLHHHH